MKQKVSMMVSKKTIADVSEGMSEKMKKLFTIKIMAGNIRAARGKKFLCVENDSAQESAGKNNRTNNGRDNGKTNGRVGGPYNPLTPSQRYSEKLHEQRSEYLLFDQKSNTNYLGHMVKVQVNGSGIEIHGRVTQRNVIEKKGKKEGSIENIIERAFNEANQPIGKTLCVQRLYAEPVAASVKKAVELSSQDKTAEEYSKTAGKGAAAGGIASQQNYQQASQ